ncbi:DUF4157 domain-containing protein [Paraburkholderia sp. UCT31]|nr:DUF4157 domain-containing protein [Paraburkholderia sp. UCT31]
MKVAESFAGTRASRATLRLRPRQGSRLTASKLYDEDEQKASRASSKTGGVSRNFGSIPTSALESATAPPAGVLLPKLAIGRVDDPLERAAERVADQVMQKPAPDVSVASANSRASKKCGVCDQENMRTLQTRPAAASTERSAEAPAAVHDVIRSPGQPLDSATRADFEPRFERDFGQVRIHHDARAAASARAVHALAYTVGRDLVFGQGQWNPRGDAGRRLLAHELAHVTQQGMSRPLLQRAPIPGWNFTPSDLQNLKGAGKDLTIAQDSSWFPAKLQVNLLNTLRFVLGPNLSPSGTGGINVLDFFHGHIVVDKKALLVDWEGNERPPEQVLKHASDFERQEKAAAATTLGGNFKETKFGPSLHFGKYPVTQKNLPAFTAAIEKLLPAFGNVLDEAATVPGAAVMYHTFELLTPSEIAAKGQKLRSEDPRRHYVTPLDTNIPRQYTPPSGASYEQEYVVIAPFSFLVDTGGGVHVRPFAASAGSGFTSLELSTLTGTPFTGEPFPVPLDH